MIGVIKSYWEFLSINTKHRLWLLLLKSYRSSDSKGDCTRYCPFEVSSEEFPCFCCFVVFKNVCKHFVGLTHAPNIKSNTEPWNLHSWFFSNPSLCGSWLHVLCLHSIIPKATYRILPSKIYCKKIKRSKPRACPQPPQRRVLPNCYL